MRLLTPRSSDAQRASALAELRRLLADYEAHARHSEEPVDPRPDDRVTDDDGRARGGQGGGQVDEPADDGSEDDDSEDPVDGGSVPAPLPYSPGVRYGPFSWFDLLYDFQLSPCAELHPFDRSLRGRTLGWPRQSWHYRGLEYRSMSWAYNGANTAFDCLNNDRVYDWEQYREKLEGEVVSCAEVTAERSDGAAATFRVAMPALGARTLEGLEDAIDERLRSGVTVVDLPITLAPEEVEDVSVGECSEPATGP